VYNLVHLDHDLITITLARLLNRQHKTLWTRIRVRIEDGGVVYHEGQVARASNLHPISALPRFSLARLSSTFPGILDAQTKLYMDPQATDTLRLCIFQSTDKDGFYCFRPYWESEDKPCSRKCTPLKLIWKPKGRFGEAWGMEM
jgi:hypothetical protein